MRGFFFAKYGAKVAQQDEAPDSVAPLFGKVVLEMARDSFYSEVSVSPYKRDGKQVGWKGTLHYHDMGELDAFGKPKRKTTSKTTLTKGKIAATAELKSSGARPEADAADARVVVDPVAPGAQKLDAMVRAWAEMRARRDSGEISEEEYLDWKRSAAHC